MNIRQLRHGSEVIPGYPDNYSHVIIHTCAVCVKYIRKAYNITLSTVNGIIVCFIACRMRTTDNDNIPTRCGSERSARSIAMNDVLTKRGCGAGGTCARACGCGHPRARRGVRVVLPLPAQPQALYAN